MWIASIKHFEYFLHFPIEIRHNKSYGIFGTARQLCNFIRKINVNIGLHNNTRYINTLIVTHNIVMKALIQRVTSAKVTGKFYFVYRILNLECNSLSLNFQLEMISLAVLEEVFVFLSVCRRTIQSKMLSICE